MNHPARRISLRSASARLNSTRTSAVAIGEPPVSQLQVAGGLEHAGVALPAIVAAQDRIHVGIAATVSAAGASGRGANVSERSDSTSDRSASIRRAEWLEYLRILSLHLDWACATPSICAPPFGCLGLRFVVHPWSCARERPAKQGCIGFFKSFNRCLRQRCRRMSVG